MTEILTNGGNGSPFDRPVTADEASWITAAYSLGTLVGPFVFGLLPDRIGKKKALLGTGIPAVIAYVLILFSKSVLFYYVARFLCGLGCGGIFSLIPAYVGEIASDHNRGALNSLLNILYCAGMLFSYVVGPFASYTSFNTILLIIPAAFLVLFFIICPESPYYLVKIGQEDQAKIAIKKLRGPSAKADDEVNFIQKSLLDEGSGTLRDILASRELKKALIITLGLMFFQQFSGIMGVLFYAQTIFTQAKVNLEPAICSIIIGSVQLVVSFITPLTVETWGRRKLLLFSSVGMFLSESILGIYIYLKDLNYEVSALSLLPLICLMVFITAYTAGYGSLPWVVMGELFPGNVKSVATTATTLVSCLVAFLVVKYFQTLAAAVGMGPTFLLFAGSSGLSIPFTYFVVIETKGKNLQEIKEKLSK